MAISAPSRNPTYLILAGIVVSVLGALLVVVLLSRPGQIAVLPQQTSSILVAARDIPARAQLADADFTVASYPAAQVPARALTSASQARGLYAAIAISRNTPLTVGMLVSAASAAQPSSQAAPLDIPPGEVALAIPSGDALSNVAGYIQSGDKVDVLVRGLPGQPAGQVAMTFRDLTIELAGSTPAAAGAGTSAQAPAGGTWVVFVPLDQAEQLVYLFNHAAYTFVLKSRHDTGATGAVAPVDQAAFNGAFNIR